MASHSIKDIVYALSPSVAHPVFRKIEASELGSRMARGFFWSMIGTVISRGLMLCATILAARILGATVYGELSLIQSTIGMLGVFAGFGLGLTANKHVAEFRVVDPERAGRIIGLSGFFAAATGGCIAMALVLLAPWLAEHTLNAPHLTGVLRVGALALFINAQNGAQTGALAGFEAFRTIAKVNFIVGVFSFPIIVSGAYFGGLNGAVWALTINLGINWLFNHLALRREARRAGVPFHVRNFGKEWPILWKFSLPAVLAGFMVGPVSWAANAILVNQPNGYEQMGLFSAANQWRIAILLIPGMFGRVVLPILSNLSGSAEANKYRKVLVINIFVSIGISVLVVVPLFFLAPYVMSAYGHGFEGGVPVLRVLAFSTVLLAGNNVIGRAIISKGKMWVGLFFNALWAVAFLVTAYILLKEGHGALGLAYASLVSYSLHAVWQAVYLIKILR